MAAGTIKNKWLIVSLLSLAYAFSFADRYLMNVLAEPIKKDFGLSDTQMSVLMGLSFALFYATLGIPIGGLADKTSRKKLMAAGIGLWSLMTCFCGAAQNYGQMLIARIGVGVGEATLSPSAYSILADYFPKKQLATALSVYSLGIYLGSGLAFLLGGRLLVYIGTFPEWNGVSAWQWLFVLFGAAGLVVSVLLLFIHEPDRKPSSTHQWREFKTFLLEKGRTFKWLCLASASFYIAVYAITTWLPSYLARVHQMSTVEIGNAMGLATLLLPSIGIIAGGKWADYRAEQSGTKGRLGSLLLFVLLLLPVCFLLTYASTRTALFVALVPYSLLVSAGVGVTAATVQELVPEDKRGIATATLLFAQNLIGLGLGPTFVALLTDYYFVDTLAIGKSLMMVSVGGLSLALLFFSFTFKSISK